MNDSLFTVLYRFTKGGHVAELCERRITRSRALEIIVVIDGARIDSQLFEGERLSLYPINLDARAAAFRADGWTQTDVVRLTH